MLQKMHSIYSWNSSNFIGWQTEELHGLPHHFTRGSSFPAQIGSTFKRSRNRIVQLGSVLLHQIKPTAVTPT